MLRRHCAARGWTLSRALQAAVEEYLERTEGFRPSVANGPRSASPEPFAPSSNS